MKKQHEPPLRAIMPDDPLTQTLETPAAQEALMREWVKTRSSSTPTTPKAE